MKIALFQYRVSKNEGENYRRLKAAIVNAAENGSNLFITQECAISGYPPIEIASTRDINFKKQDLAVKEIIEIAIQKDIHVLLGLIRQENNKLKNSIMMITPTGKIDYYDKRALWGWDIDNYEPGSNFDGIIEINQIRIGVRICFEIRFPEYFRELYKNKVDIAVVSFCDISDKPDLYRLNIIKSH